MINKDRLVRNFVTMVGVPSTSGQEGQFRDLLKEYFQKMGLTAEEDEAGSRLEGNSGNLLVKVPGSVAAPPILFATHMDTVVPGTDIKAIIGPDLIIRSEGPTILGSDDKAGIASLLEAIEIIIEKSLPHPPLELLFTVSEEQGLLGAKNFDFRRLAASQGYALDSGGSPGTIVIKSPCQNEIEYKVYGRSAHAGINPEDGINAIQVMSKALAVMPCGRVDAETTCNFGIIKGGMARNVVAAECYVKGEARSLNRSKLNQLTAELIAIFTREVEANGGRVETEVTFLYPEITLEPEEDVVVRAVQAAKKLSLQPDLISTGGGSDASIISGHNIRCVNLGIGMNAVHTTEEFISIKDLINVSKLILGIVELAANE
jgi:tripeptide aminopeptidase